MAELFNPPTRNQLARLANGDQRLLRALEKLFEVVGQDTSTELTEIVEDISELQIDSGTALSIAQSASLSLVKTAQRARSNEVLLWLSM